MKRNLFSMIYLIYTDIAEFKKTRVTSTASAREECTSSPSPTNVTKNGGKKLPGQECKSELFVGAGLKRVRWTAWYSQIWWLVQWNRVRHPGKNGAWDAFWKRAMSRLLLIFSTCTEWWKLYPVQLRHFRSSPARLPSPSFDYITLHYIIGISNATYK